MNMSLSKLQELVKDRKVQCAAVHGTAKGRTQLSNLNSSIVWKIPFILCSLHVCIYFYFALASVGGKTFFLSFDLCSTTGHGGPRYCPPSLSPG